MNLWKAASSASCSTKNIFRSASKRTLTSLHDILESQIPEKQAQMAKLRKEHGSVTIGEVTIEQVIGGARGVKALVWETSNLDPEEGIRFRGLTIPECQKRLPGYTAGGEPAPESLIWLLLTGKIPTKAESDSLTADFHKRSQLPSHIEPMIRSFPRNMHPMTQFAAAVAAMQTDSKFAKAYHGGINKRELWKYAFEDILDLIAKLPEVASLIYRCKYHDGKIRKDQSLDYSGNFARMLGYKNPKFDELLRLYMVIHSDHEGGNASAHTTHLVGSTLSDPYLSFSAGLCALAGPLHGLANQEVLSWILELEEEFKKAGKPIDKETIEEFTLATLNAGKVIPGYGHAVLRKTDPRYEAQRQFALKHLPDDKLFHIVSTVYEVVPKVLGRLGKVRNPWPNVDAHSGALLCHYGFTEHEYYTVLFGVSRAMGALSQLFWDRALGFPLERPKSVTPEYLWSQAKKQ